LIFKSDVGIRKLTPRECFNFQGFPKNIVLPKELSDSSLYKIAGNAVSLPVIEKLVLNLSKILESN
jgi:DNA (cytosine-5)-methyltransferase 1